MFWGLFQPAHRFLASGMSQLDVASYFPVGVSTASGIIPDVCSAIWEKLAPVEMPVPDTNKWIAIAEESEERWNFPHCLIHTYNIHTIIHTSYEISQIHFNYQYFDVYFDQETLGESFKIIIMNPH